MCAFKKLSHSGDENRWHSVKEHRSRSLVEMVGSWVEIKMRAPRCRCWRIVDRIVSVNFTAAAVPVMYCVRSVSLPVLLLLAMVCELGGWGGELPCALRPEQ